MNFESPRVGLCKEEAKKLVAVEEHVHSRALVMASTLQSVLAVFRDARHSIQHVLMPCAVRAPGSNELFEAEEHVVVVPLRENNVATIPGQESVQASPGLGAKAAPVDATSWGDHCAPLRKGPSSGHRRRRKLVRSRSLWRS